VSCPLDPFAGQVCTQDRPRKCAVGTGAVVVYAVLAWLGMVIGALIALNSITPQQ
jgi:hypothetical protein